MEKKATIEGDSNDKEDSEPSTPTDNIMIKHPPQTIYPREHFVHDQDIHRIEGNQDHCLPSSSPKLFNFYI